ncbi:MAG: hypothetical protein O3A31_06450 [Planctomycetota bacterium]|nr:hypothetical protein [Planctomycetota bacterium]
MSFRDSVRSFAYRQITERLRNAPRGDPEAFVNIAWTALAPTGVSWIGFYRMASDRHSMVLEQCRDRPACSPIGLHGVCGQAARTGRTMIVGDVADLGDDYVACDPRDRSEIVIPIHADLLPGGQIGRVLDLDSFETNSFSDLDGRRLREALRIAGFAPAGDRPEAPEEREEMKNHPR